MTATIKNRVSTIDMLKGLVMVIMALDHVRDYFHFSAFYFDPADPVQSNLPLFFTRWITHFCAPAFSFLAGMSAFMAGKRKTTGALSAFLFKRGLWLVFMELTIVGFGWFFDFQFRTLTLLVIASLGFSMMVLAALVHLPRKYILIFSIIVIAGHNLLDNIHIPGSMLWSLLHVQQFFTLNGHFNLLIGYPVVPWIAVMSLGYCFGYYYDGSFVAAQRKRIFNMIGLSAIVLFLVLRYFNLYGDQKHFEHFNTFSQSLISFLNPSKYPPSLQYLLMTLGGLFLFLANTEKLKGRLVEFFSTFGRVPFFYYVLHIYLIHLLAMLFAYLSGWPWQSFILSTWIGFAPGLKGYGFSIWVVYAVWLGVVFALYPLCKKFDSYKQANKQKWWLSYL